MNNTIKPGDRVSWRLDGDSRHFGTVVDTSLAKLNVYRVIDTMSVYRVIPTRFITKEVG